MLANIAFWLGLVGALLIGFFYFRDLGDVSQMVIRVKRKNMLRFIRNEYRLLAIGLGALALSAIAHFGFTAGPSWVWWTALCVSVILYGFPYIWVHVGLRNQKNSARYYSIEEAKDHVSPSSQVIVNENNGVARAHPQAQLLRPHLGISYTPEVEGQKLDLEVLAQHGNNLVLRDNQTGEPVQQIYGFREADARQKKDGGACPLRPSLAMRPWPTFRMTFRGFQKAYPEGTVFVNKPPSNPILYLFDMVLELLFSSSIERQHREAKPVMDNMTHYDDRLPNKTYVWGVDFDDDAVCWTDDFIVDQGNIVNAEVGGHPLVVAWSPGYESLGIWYNDTGESVAEIDFFGRTPAGRLKRVEVMRPGLFWHVWVEFFPHTDINRIAAEADQKAP